MNHLKKVIALLKAELKKVEKEVLDEDGEFSSEVDVGIIEGLGLAISIAEDYDNQTDPELSTSN